MNAPTRICIAAAIAVGAILPGRLDAESPVPGLLMRVIPIPWIEIELRHRWLFRKGTASVYGNQLIEQFDPNASSSTSAALHYFQGDVKDKGFRSQVEVTFRYCRWSLHLGYLEERLTRTYSSYFGLVEAPNIDSLLLKTRSYGYGETSGSFRHSRYEYYARVGVAGFF